MPTAGSPTQTPLEDAAPRQRRWCKNFDLGGGESQITMRHSVAAGDRSAMKDAAQPQPVLRPRATSAGVCAEWNRGEVVTLNRAAMQSFTHIKRFLRRMATAALRERDLLTCRSCRRRTGADAASPGVLFPALWAVDRFGVVRMVHVEPCG
jgi:hypothetical protein